MIKLYLFQFILISVRVWHGHGSAQPSIYLSSFHAAADMLSPSSSSTSMTSSSQTWKLLEAWTAHFLNQTDKVEEPKRYGLLRIKIVDNGCINHQKRTELMPFFLNLRFIKAISFPQSPHFASNILRFCGEPDKLMKMLPEPNNTILMSASSII